MVRNGGDPRAIIADRGLAQVSDEGAIAGIIDEVLAANPDKVEQYRGGKTGLLGFFIGQVMRSSAGQGQPSGHPAAPGRPTRQGGIAHGTQSWTVKDTGMIKGAARVRS